MKLVAIVLLLLSFLAGARVEAAAGDSCASAACSPASLVCDTDAKCKNKVDGVCTAPTSTALCPINATCPGADNAPGICTCSVNFQKDSDLCKASPGRPCSAASGNIVAVLCVTGHTCESGTCKAQAGKDCNAGATPPVSCITGLTCSSTTGAGKCSGAASVIASLALLLTSIVTSRFL